MNDVTQQRSQAGGKCAPQRRLLGILLLPVRRQRWPLLVAGGVLLVLLLDVVLLSPHLLIQAFNPLSTNLAALALCAVAWLAEAPSAADS